MDKSEAKIVLSRSVSNLHSRRGSLTIEDIEAEVINNACLTFLKKRREISKSARNIEEIITGLINSTLDAMPIAKAYIDAAYELFPAYYSDREAASAIIGIQNNIEWEGMWDFLRDYFESNHGIKIDDIETNTTIFYSNRHERFENEILMSKVDVARAINVNFIENEEIVIAIAPTLTPKKAYLVSDRNSIKTYKGFDPDYLFTVEFDEFDEIQKFILSMPNRNLRIEYFE
jgi:hypothetical protein